MRAIALTIAVLALAGCAAPSIDAPGPTDDGPSTSGAPHRIEKTGCRLYAGSSFERLDDARHSRFPPGYEPLGADGTAGGEQATVQVIPRVIACEHGTVDGRTFGGSNVGGVGIPVCPPPEVAINDCSDNVLLRLWSDHPEEAAAFASWGFGGAGSVSATATRLPDGTSSFVAEARGADVEFAFSSSTAGATALAFADDHNRWFAFEGLNVTGYVDVRWNLTGSLVGASRIEVDDARGLFSASGVGPGPSADVDMAVVYHPIEGNRR